jgi:hypothetical protein
LKDILLHINGVEGVMGSFVFNEQGEVLAHALPAHIGAAAMKQIATLSLNCGRGLQSAETLKSLEFRYREGRLVIRPSSGVMLCILCNKNIHMHLLSIALNVVGKTLDHLVSPLQAPADSPSPTSSHTEHVSGDTPLRLTVAKLSSRGASSSFDSLGMIAVSKATSEYIREIYKTDFRKLALFNVNTNTRGVFPVMVIKDVGASFDNTIIVGPGVEKKLRAGIGDLLEVEIG